MNDFFLDVKKELAENQDGDKIPGGTYNVVTYAAKFKDFDNGDRLVKLNLQILDGPLVDKKIFLDIPTVNGRSPKRANIGRAHLAKIAYACGIEDKLTSLTILIGRPFQISLKWNGDFMNISAIAKYSRERVMTAQPQPGGHSAAVQQTLSVPMPPMLPMTTKPGEDDDFG